MSGEERGLRGRRASGKKERRGRKKVGKEVIRIREIGRKKSEGTDEKETPCVAAETLHVLVDSSEEGGEERTERMWERRIRKKEVGSKGRGGCRGRWAMEERWRKGDREDGGRGRRRTSMIRRRRGGGGRRGRRER